MKQTLVLFLFLLGSICLFAQQQELVSFEYENQQLYDVLVDLHQQYGINFSYSKDLIPIDKEITLSIEQKSLNEALDILFKSNGIAATKINNQYVLKPSLPDEAGPNAEGNNTLPAKLSIPAKEKALNRRVLRTVPQRTEPIRHLPPFESPSLEQFELVGAELPMLDQSKPKSEVELVFEDLADRIEYEMPEAIVVPAQISVLPNMALRGDSNNVNNISFNVIWGRNAGVQGLEAGMLNSITDDVKGVQIAGLGSTVGGAVNGLQASGLFCATNGDMTGLQAAGMFNTADNVEIMQAAGLANVARGDVKGLQAAGLANVTAGKSEGGQVAGAINFSKNDVIGVQASGLLNYASDVNGVQIASLLNIAKEVKGTQIALVNISESVEGVPIGFLNIVKNGYNHIEIFTQDRLTFNANVKLGARSFHNIFEFSTNKNQNFMAIGYGVGSTTRIVKNLDLSAELVAKQVKEDDEWSTNLNVLSQLRLPLSYSFAKHFSLFGGPVLNLMITERIDPDTGVFGSSLAHKSFFKQHVDGITSEMWMGFTAGLRF